MSYRHLILKSLLVLTLLVNALTMGVAAQSQPRQIMLDTEATRIAEVHTNGQAFIVYRVDNALPYASGIEVYSNGERVTSESTVEEVFRALARRKATKFQPERETIAKLRRVIEQSQALQTTTTEAIIALNETLEYRGKLQETTINDSSAWEIATEKSDALDEGFASGFTGSSDAVEVRNQLQVLRASATELEKNATRVITLLEQQQAGEDIDQSDLYRRFASVYSDLETMNQLVSEVGDRTVQLAETSRTAATQVKSVPQVGDNLQERLTSLASSLNETEASLADVGPGMIELREELPKVAADVQFQEKLMKQWNRRQAASMKVYFTIGGSLILLVAGVIAVSENRS